MSRNVLVLVTCGSAKEAKKIAEALVRKRLAACVNVMPGSVLSVYRWKRKIERAREFLLLIKTSRHRYVELEGQVRKINSYKVPEILALPIERGSKQYLNWLQASVSTTERIKKRV